MQTIVEQNRRMIALLEEIRDSISRAIELPAHRSTTIDITTHSQDPGSSGRAIVDAISNVVGASPENPDRHVGSRYSSSRGAADKVFEDEIHRRQKITS